MEQQDFTPRNRAERMRWRAFFIEGRAGRYDNYSILTRLSLERIRDTSDWVDWSDELEE